MILKLVLHFELQDTSSVPSYGINPVTFNKSLTNHDSNTTTSPPHSKTTMRICSHRERQSYISNICNDLKHNIQPSQVGHSRMITDEKRKLFYCEVSKAGCTSWKALWEFANMNITDRLPNSTLGIHSLAVMDQAGLTFTEDWRKLYIINYTKFIVIRNPFDRVYSAYLNTIGKETGLPGPDKTIINFINQYNIQNGGYRHLTFSQFLGLILDNSSFETESVRNDRHWRPITETCHVCEINYDYIIRLETINHDAAPLLQILGYPEDLLLNNKVVLHAGSDTWGNVNYAGNLNSSLHGRQNSSNIEQNKIGNKYIAAYKDIIGTDLYKKFLERYRFDIKLFGYDLDRYTLTTQCKTSLNSGETCC